MAIPDDDVARVRAATDIVALIGEHAALKRQGRRWVGLCPFHQEKSPSFSVNAEEGLFYCFGCQTSGDAITFVREVEHVDFVEAVRRLADRAGVVITEDSAATAEHRRRAPLLAAMAAAVDWYHDRLLTSPDAGPARDYLRSRGYDGDVVRAFRLGWAPDDWDALARHLRVSDQVLADAGLGFVNRRGRQQDAWRGRVIFPIFDPSDRPIAIGGRILPARQGASTDAPGPKYKNSPEGPIYAKRRTLYGLNFSKRDIIANGEVVVCEGYTDVIACFQAGIPRAVATCGTALGEEHFRLLSNFARRIVLAYDADAAGQSGASRVYEWERHHQVDVAVAALPPGSDPGDLARSAPEELRRAVADAEPFLSFRVERVMQAADLRSAEGRARAAEGAMAAVIEHPNELVRDQYLMRVADRCRLEPGALRDLADRLRRQEPPRDGRGAPAGDGRSHRWAPPGGDSSPPGGAGREAPASDPGPVGARRVPTGRYGPMGRHAPASGAPPQPATGRWRPGLEALRLAVHRPESVATRLEAALFADPVQRAVFEILARATDLHDAVEAAEAEDPAAADLIRRLAVEEPTADADAVIVQLVRAASRQALSAMESQARRSSGDFAGLAAEIGRVRADLQELDDSSGGPPACGRLLAWLVGRAEETT